MTPAALMALLPMMVVAGAAILVMLSIALRRDFKLAFFLTLTGLLLAMLCLPLGLAPVQATALILIDLSSVFFSGLLLGAALVSALLCQGHWQGLAGDNEEVFVLLLTAVLGGLTLVSSSHFATLFLGLEILSVSLFPMIAYRMDKPSSLEAGIKYLMLSGLASALLLFGMALVYGEFGTLSFQSLTEPFEKLDSNPLALVGMLLMVAGLGFKLSLVPFHGWTPDVYQGAPTPVTAFLSTVSKTAVFALLLRFFILAQAHRSAVLLDILSLMAVLSILVGNLLALLQTRIKRMLAYSSIAHMGYLLVAFVAASHLQTGLLTESVGFYLVAYVTANLGAFGGVSALAGPDCEGESTADCQGLFWRDPWLAGILTVNLLSLAGIPLTIGFIGKVYVFATSVQAGRWPLLASVVVGSGMGLYYYLKVVLTMLEPGLSTERRERSVVLSVNVTLMALAFLTLGLGVFPEPLMELLKIVEK